jgi:hypothetical protein
MPIETLQGLYAARTVASYLAKQVTDEMKRASRE